MSRTPGVLLCIRMLTFRQTVRSRAQHATNGGHMSKVFQSSITELENMSEGLSQRCHLAKHCAAHPTHVRTVQV